MSFYCFSVHRELLTDIGLYKQTIFQLQNISQVFLRNPSGQQPRNGETMETAASGALAERKGKSGKMYVMGIDSGSTSTDAVIMDKGQKIVASAVVRTGAALYALDKVERFSD